MLPIPADMFDGLATFLAVAERKSFTAAAADLGVSPAAVSQSVRVLEERMGLPLFQRTSRRVGLTEAGVALLERLRPAANAIADAVDSLNTLRDRPVGHLRLCTQRSAIPLVIEPVMPRFRAAYPEISVELGVEDPPVDLATGGWDAGIGSGECVERDLIGVPLTPDITWIIVGAPAYLDARGRPASPEELLSHECIGYRMPGERAYRWELEHDGRSFAVDVRSSMFVSDYSLGASFARLGLGLAYTEDLAVAEDLAAGRLERVLADYSPQSAAIVLYFPARAQTQPKLRAFIDLAVATLKPRGSSAQGTT